MNRDLARTALFDRSRPWDVVVIGGGATGLGVALDAQTRGYRTLLLEQTDFAAATSSRSTKLIHGGVRYLPQGHLALVRQALAERALLLRNAPDLVRPQRFVIPVGSRWRGWYYRSGLAIYDALARLPRRSTGAGEALPHSRRMSVAELSRALPDLAVEGRSGAVAFFDARFDDAALALRLADRFVAAGGTALNYARVARLLHAQGQVTGVLVRDLEVGDETEATARAVVNATGVFSDQLRRLDDPGAHPRLVSSRGSHLVIASVFSGSEDALLLPETPDGRVLFAIPWMGRTLVGTTEIAVETVDADPHPTSEEIEFLLAQISAVARRNITRADITSVFSGLRPLLRDTGRGAGGDAAAPDRMGGGAAARSTRALSREHAIEVSATGLVTIAGGKWTTYRLMAEQTVDRAATVGGLPSRPCRTAHLRLDPIFTPVVAIPEISTGWDPSTIEASVRHAVRHQMARTVEDVLARRIRLLFVDAGAARIAAEPVARWMAEELGRDRAWVQMQLASFSKLCDRYLP
ncbi:MAG: glycerol-3-phosphate dehydrogenase/oxidase [Candidatus Eisenbacteria bacterium]|uniref:Glycerol-3-phosphate dehydrogenase/oxidase n=1 Tax=Eiseniibacteriota bacterium TaxID=2212470 RepID=A0A956M3Z2_UNCEI|nr:glycerol-3-phosphate dehydrogenase/oxidase [Candidatus Eisenbacteria bacterium]